MAYCDVYITSLSFATADPEVMNRFADAGLSVNRNPLSRRMTGQEIAEMAGQARAIIACTDDLGSVARDSEHLRQIVRLGVGLDGVPLEICAEKGIAVVNTPDAVTDSVAEFTLSLILAVERRVFQSDRLMRNGTWDRELGRSLSECTIGLVGFGRIGAAVAKLLRGMGVRDILITDPIDRRHVFNDPSFYGMTLTQLDLDSLLAKSDIVSLHAPNYLDGKVLVSKRELRLMKSSASLVNTARGALIHERDLIQHLNGNASFRAALDVFQDEPYAGPLLDLANVILTSHIASNTTQTRINMDNAAIDAILHSTEQNS